ncbi:hypothetical protein GCM10017044_01450 [Kordiimonas sediminis]|uniref:Tetratricopeptide repeat protein n=1 Tax=Kordiimonas sediminis TaxID=1735581 RepID=A0A919E3X6_9PROT|nr:hypothetical protein [Kordiimonas sediminis]GHF11406.1 hypothetical protein GCM10017044_01450 [Kordiimonas sediminis]
MKKQIIGLLTAVTMTAGVTAQDVAFDFADEVRPVDAASEALKSGDWASAEAELLQSSLDDQDSVYAKLNLAFLYGTTGRSEQAAAIYQEILDGRDNSFAMVLSGKPRRVKAIAREGLKRLTQD